MMTHDHNAPRLYVESNFHTGAHILPQADAVHYLCHVLRKNVGDVVRIFNGRDGEARARIETITKKSMTLYCESLLRPQPGAPPLRALAFAPLKGPRLDILIEKAVELGVSDFYPLITRFTQHHKLNEPRIARHIIEAAEQSERMTIPVFHPLRSLEDFLKNPPASIFAALERGDFPRLKPQQAPWCFLIGPEGGFSDDEKNRIQATTQPVNLGETILRAETAAIAGLSILNS